MQKKNWMLKMSFICLIALFILFGIETNSYANQTNEYEEEMTEVLQAYENMDVGSQQQLMSNMQSSSINIGDLSEMDLETLLMMVQSQRTALLDEQLRNQIEEVNARNQRTAKLYEQLAEAQLQKSRLSDDQVEEMAEIDRVIKELKNEIGSQSNTQQMDMLRLQALSNKRNEAFDVMTNFIKKMQNSRSSIIGNMR